LIEVHAPQLAQAAQPGQYCMVRCCDTSSTDPLLRRPFFIHTVRREQGLCTLLVHVRGRGTAWLVKQQEGASLDILGPLGQGFGTVDQIPELCYTYPSFDASMNASYCALCVISLSRIPGEARRCCFRRMAVEANSQQCERRTCYESCMFQKRLSEFIVKNHGNISATGEPNLLMYGGVRFGESWFKEVIGRLL